MKDAALSLSLFTFVALTPITAQAIMVSQGMASTNTVQDFNALTPGEKPNVVDLGSAAMSGTLAPATASEIMALPNGEFFEVYNVSAADPSDPLTLVGQGTFNNLFVGDPTGGIDLAVTGLISPLFLPSPTPVSSLTAGSVFFLFDDDQSVVGIDLLNIATDPGTGALGTFYFSFFDRSGSLIDPVVELAPGENAVPEGPYTFTSNSAIIAGFGIFTDDLEGAAYDNLRYNVPTSSTPGPATALLLAIGLAGLAVARVRPRR